MNKACRIMLGIALALVGAPLLADKLVFDYRLVPELKAVFDGGDPAMLSYDGRNPRNLVNVIAVRGKSAKEWDEAMVIIARTPDAKIATVEGWLAQLQSDAAKQCPSRFTVLSRDEISLTVERRSTGCKAGYPPVALYRIVKGAPSLFMLAAMTKTDFTQAARSNWLSLMASAHLE